MNFPTDRETHQRIAYRLSPVLNDVQTDSVWFSPIGHRQCLRPRRNRDGQRTLPQPRWQQPPERAGAG